MSETASNYRYMAKHVKTMGHAVEYFNRPRHLLYSDRAKGIAHFESQFGGAHAHCLAHIVKNVRDHVRAIPAARKSFHEDQIHNIQQAPTEEEFRTLLNRFARGFPHAAQYLDSLPHEKVFSYRFVRAGYATHGHRTSNIVAIMNNVLKQVRNLDCYRICNFIASSVVGGEVG